MQQSGVLCLAPLLGDYPAPLLKFVSPTFLPACVVSVFTRAAEVSHRLPLQGGCLPPHLRVQHALGVRALLGSAAAATLQAGRPRLVPPHAGQAPLT